MILQHLVGEPSQAAAAASELLASGTQLYLTDVDFAAVIGALEAMDQEVSRPKVAMLGRAVLGHPTIATIDDSLLLRALEQYELNGRSFVDAYAIATAERSGLGLVVLDGGDVTSVDDHRP